MAKIFKVPFASQGDKTPIPDAAQGDGSVSYNQGFGYDYERPYEDPQSKDIPREGMNQIFNDLSGAVGEIQAAGVAQWSPDADPYPIGAIVWRNNSLWQSTVGVNAGEPGITSGWSGIDAQRLRDATESIRGVAQIATQSQVDAGTDDTSIVTPKKLRAGFSIQLGSSSGYVALPSWMGGLIIQWGTIAAGFDISRVVVTLPIAFPVKGFRPIVSNGAANSSAAYIYVDDSDPKTTFGINWGSGVANKRANWICIGH